MSVITFEVDLYGLIVIIPAKFTYKLTLTCNGLWYILVARCFDMNEDCRIHIVWSE